MDTRYVTGHLATGIPQDVYAGTLVNCYDLQSASSNVLASSPIIGAGGDMSPQGGHIPPEALLAQERTIILGTPINSSVANGIVSMMLVMAADDPAADINLYINSPGGEVSAGLAILDTMNFISCDVATTCMGMAASMAAVLLAAGAPGKRSALPHGRTMIHQPSGGASGRQTDLSVAVRELTYCRETLDGLLAEYTGKSIEEVHKDTERDFFMSPAEALEYGLIDRVIGTSRRPDNHSTNNSQH